MNDKQQLSQKPMAFFFSGSKPDKRRAAASAGSGKDKESAEAKELLKRVDERYNSIFYSDKCCGKNFPALIAKYHWFKFCEKYLGQNCCFSVCIQ